MNALTIDRFDEFVDAVTPGRIPFPWQQRLLRDLVDGRTGDETNEPGRWPALCALPTGTGKTSLIDIAVYAMALGVPIPRRIFFVVDRRIIVAQSAEHARHLAQRLGAGEGILAEVAAGLRSRGAPALGSNADDPELVPLRVAELRGAIEQDNAWAMRPDQPCVIATTVDQLGSRLLFRGYGVSDRMRPIHAGLVGNDALLLLDEVHLARPFAALVRDLGSRFMRPKNGLNWQVVELSATPTPAFPQARRFALQPDDLDDPRLRRVLEADKPVRTLSIRTPSDPDKTRAMLVRACVEQVVEILKDPRVRRVALVVNRVRTAAMIAEELSSASNADTLLVTGRMRDRCARSTAQVLRERVGAGWRQRVTESDGDPQQLVVVATQTIEVGADYDFDVLVTECASIDALVQRLGRVNRRGSLPRESDGALAMPSSVVIGWDRLVGTDDPVYGQATGATWEWLRDHSVDFRPGSLRLDELGPELFAPVRKHPVLLRSHLDRWIRTSPRPHADLDIAPFLHGFDAAADPEVEIIWRADLLPAVLDVAARDSDAARGTIDQLAAVAPSRGEAVSVPASKARSWLRRPDPGLVDEHADADLVDIEGGRSNTLRGAVRSRAFVLWRGDQSVITYDTRQMRAGDIVVVPATYGGLSSETWAPHHSAAVIDDAADCALENDELVIRMNPWALAPYSQQKETNWPRMRQFLLDENDQQSRRDERSGDTQLPCIPTPAFVSANDLSAVDAVHEWLVLATSYLNFSDALRAALTPVLDDLNAEDISVVGSAVAGMIPTYVIVRRIGATASRTSADSEPAGSSYVGRRYELDAHLADVERWSRHLADACGAPGDLTDILAAAGALHDLGKADPRFQSQLREGELALGDPLLAKSAIGARNRAGRDRAQDTSGYPRRLRHELTSLELLDGFSLGTTDDELVRYLVATHHGYCRPFAPPQVDLRGVEVHYGGALGDLRGRSDHTLGTVGATVAPMLSHFVDRLGHYGVAYCETLLRLADHGASRNAGLEQPGSIQLRLGQVEQVANRVAKQLELPALHAASAHTFLAAIGVIEALHRTGSTARLSWTSGLRPRAVLHGIDRVDKVIDAILLDRDRRMADFVLNFPAGEPFDTLGRSQEEFNAWLGVAAEQDDSHPDLDLFSGLVIEGGLTAGGASKPSHFDLTAGQAKFLRIVRSLGSALDAAMVREAVIGPWRYAGTQSTLRFEATGERLAALRGVPPALEPVRGVGGADWLAFLALSYYPLALRHGPDRDRVVTPACDRDWNRSAFRWPIWRDPLSRGTIAALVTDPTLVDENEGTRRVSQRDLAARNVTQVWHSGLVRSAQGYGSFSPPKLIASANL